MDIGQDFRAQLVVKYMPRHVFAPFGIEPFYVGHTAAEYDDVRIEDIDDDRKRAPEAER